MIYIKLFWEFFRTGLFSFGGGYATLPFLYNIAQTQKWYTVQQLSDMVALSSVTPGPVGVNVATFAGFSTAGVIGSMIATFAVVLPSFVIIIFVSKLVDKFKQNNYFKSIIYMLKPTACGLLAATGINMFINSINFTGFVLLAGLFIASMDEKRSPLFYLGISAITGLVAGFFGLTN